MTGAAAVLTFLAKLPEYIEKGITARVIKGNTTLEVGGNKKFDHNDEPIEDNPENKEL